MLMEKQKGVGLIELMVSVTIGMMILAGVVQLYLTSVESQRSQEGLSRIQENMRYLSSRLSVEVGKSGFLGCVPRAKGGSNRIYSFLTKDASENDGDGAPEKYHFGAGGAVSGSNNGGVNGSDTVSFRFSTVRSIPLKQKQLNMGAQSEMTLDNTGANKFLYEDIDQWDVGLITDCNYAHVFLVTNEPDTDGVVEFKSGEKADSGPNVDQQNTAHSIGRSYFGQENANNDGTIPAKFLIIGTGGYTYNLNLSARGKAEGGSCDSDYPQYCALFLNGEELMEGISDFQVDYGWKTGTTVNYGDSKIVSDMNGWADVDRVRMNFTVSAIESTGTNDKGSRGRVERTFSQVVIMRNPLIETRL